MGVPGSPDRDESTSARRIALLHRTTHFEVQMDQSCIRDLPALLAVGEPLGDSSIIPTAAVARQAKTRFKVALTGDGGDEALGGYGKPEIAVRAGRISNSLQGVMCRLMSPFLEFLSYQRLTPGLRRFRPQGAKLMRAA